MSPHAIIWAVAAVVTAGVVIRPFDWPETVWAVNGAALLVTSRLLSAGDARIGDGRAGARSACRRLRAVSPRHLCLPSDSRAKSSGRRGRKLILVRDEGIR